MRFDAKKVIIDPSLLVKGKRYFVSKRFSWLKNAVESGETQGKTVTFKGFRKDGAPTVGRGIIYPLWYPAYEDDADDGSLLEAMWKTHAHDEDERKKCEQAEIRKRDMEKMESKIKEKVCGEIRCEFCIAHTDSEDYPSGCMMKDGKAEDRFHVMARLSNWIWDYDKNGGYKFPKEDGDVQCV